MHKCIPYTTDLLAEIEQVHKFDAESGTSTSLNIKSIFPQFQFFLEAFLLRVFVGEKRGTLLLQ